MTDDHQTTKHIDPDVSPVFNSAPYSSRSLNISSNLTSTSMPTVTHQQVGFPAQASSLHNFWNKNTIGNQLNNYSWNNATNVTNPCNTLRNNETSDFTLPGSYSYVPADASSGPTSHVTASTPRSNSSASNYPSSLSATASILNNAWNVVNSSEPDSFMYHHDQEQQVTDDPLPFSRSKASMMKRIEKLEKDLEEERSWRCRLEKAFSDVLHAVGIIQSELVSQ